MAGAWRRAPLYHAPSPALLAEDRANGMDAAWVRGADPVEPAPEVLLLLEPGAAAPSAAARAPAGSVLGADPRHVAPEELAGLAGFNGRALTLTASPEHRRGAPPEVEVAVLLAGLLAAARAMGPEAAARHAAYRIEGEREIVEGVAKIGALRRLHAAWAEWRGVSGAPAPFVHAVTSWRTMTRVDPWVNLMRATTQALAAAVAGADAITVLPYDAALGQPSERGRRLARNTHAILLHEAHLARVRAPAAGAEAIEARTEEIAREAWAVLRGIEDAGGLAEFVLDGRHQAGRDRLLRTRALPITGVSEFPDDAPPPERPPAPMEDGLRDARAFEALRDRLPLRVHLRALGPLRDHKPRLDFARNFFRVGGAVFVDDPRGAVACLCGTDEAYDAAQVEELRAAGARKVALAGRTKLPGLDARVFKGCDVVATLEELGS